MFWKKIEEKIKNSGKSKIMLKKKKKIDFYLLTGTIQLINNYHFKILLLNYCINNRSIYDRF